MSKSNIVHDTFVIEHSYPVPPARVFAAFADDEVKRRWFLLDEGLAVTDVYQNDFRIGGKETTTTCGGRGLATVAVVGVGVIFAHGAVTLRR